RRVALAEAVQTAFQGTEVGQVYLGPRTIDVRVLLDPRRQRDLTALGDLWLSVPDAETKAAGRIQLKQVADVYLSDGRFLIAHEGGLRRQQVTCGVEKRDVTSFVAEVERKLRQLELPEGAFYTLAGEHEARA